MSNIHCHPPASSPCSRLCHQGLKLEFPARGWQLHPWGLLLLLPCDLERSNSHPCAVPSLPQARPAAEPQIRALINEQQVNALIKQPVVPRSLPVARSLPWLQVLAVPSPSQVPDHEHPSPEQHQPQGIPGSLWFCGVSFAGKEKKNPEDFNTGYGRTVAIFSLEGTLKL